MRQFHLRLDQRESDARRDEAVAQVEHNAPEDWKDEAHEAIRQACLRHDEFIIDQVWAYMTTKPHEARAMGAAIRRAVKAGFCERTDRYRTSAQPQCHSNPRVIWKSLLR